MAISKLHGVLIEDIALKLNLNFEIKFKFAIIFTVKPKNLSQFKIFLCRHWYYPILGRRETQVGYQVKLRPSMSAVPDTKTLIKLNPN